MAADANPNPKPESSRRAMTSPISPDDHVEGYVDALLPSRAVLVLTAESEYLAIGGRFPS
jgi:hypothetical protein